MRSGLVTLLALVLAMVAAYPYLGKSTRSVPLAAVALLGARCVPARFHTRPASPDQPRPVAGRGARAAPAALTA
jgi:hypothetical protein